MGMILDWRSGSGKRWKRRQGIRRGHWSCSSTRLVAEQVSQLCNPVRGQGCLQSARQRKVRPG